MQATEWQYAFVKEVKRNNQRTCFSEFSKRRVWGLVKGREKEKKCDVCVYEVLSSVCAVSAIVLFCIYLSPLQPA